MGPVAPAIARHLHGPIREAVKRAAVLGAGTMGAQIAGLMASCGVPCDLLDLADTSGGRSRLAEEGRKRLLSLKPSPLYTAKAVDLIRPGSIDHDLAGLADADWVIEAVVEDLDAKRELWAKVAPYLKPGAIASTNTSGIPISSIAEALPREARSRFLGTHFFNPPRYMRLLELTPTPDTDPAVVHTVRAFGEEVLGKGVVIAHDVPNFIANRLGLFGVMATLRAMDEFGLAPDEVDGVTGPAMGRPASATFRTVDLVGIDVVVRICDHMRKYVTEAWERDAFVVPTYLRTMVERGWLGEKSGQGFYKRVVENGETRILALDPRTLEYRPRRRLQAPSLVAVREVDDASERLRALIASDDQAGRFAWRVLSTALWYAAQKAGEVADDIASIDRAMRWGFGWELGLFEAWDAVGVAEAVRRMRSDGLDVPHWVAKLAEANSSFYTLAQHGQLQAAPEGATMPVLESPRVLSTARLRASGRRILEKPDSTVFDLGDGVAFVDFHSPKQAIGPDLMDTLDFVAVHAPGEYRGVVVGSHVPGNFCVGANLMLILLAAREAEWGEIDAMIRRFQQTLLRMKRLPVPVVVAPFGMTLGGGLEVALSSDRIVAATESYMGLVEVGAGLIPAGGGCKEALIRATEGLASSLDGVASRGGFAPPVDLQPVVARLFETIGTAKVAGSAVEAKGLDFLRSSDVVVPNLDHLLFTAKEAVLALDVQGYAPPDAAKVPVLGASTRALLELAAQHLVWGGHATDHDLKIARKLAYVLTGGDRPAGTTAPEEYFLDLEREAFLSLCGEPKTQARMQHLLKTGRPLRN